MQSTDPAAIASRMSPYQQAVIDIQKREALRDAEKLQQQIGASAVGAGAFGGSRESLQQTELARQTGQRLADIQAVGSQQAYQQAMNQLASDRAASLEIWSTVCGSWCTTTTVRISWTWCFRNCRRYTTSSTTKSI